MKIHIAALLLIAAPAAAQAPRLDAAASDPNTLGWMQGFPPPPEKQVRFDDASMWAFPRTRWSFSHIRELTSTAAIPRATSARPGPAVPLPRSDRREIDAISFTPIGGEKPMTWQQSLAANYTDGIVVLHRGRIVYEAYFGAGSPDRPHILFSVTKSFVGSLAETLIAENRLDPNRTIGSYVPELVGSGFADATIRQALDMRTGLAYTEEYAGMGSELTDPTRMAIAAGSVAAPPGYKGPLTTMDFLKSIGKAGAHGGDFVYRTPNTQAIAFVLERITGKSIADQISERYWTRLGMEQDAAIQIDRLGTGFAGGGMMATVRDMARFGEMVRRGGRAGRQDIIPRLAMRAINAPGDVRAFAGAKYPGLEGGSYASQWWHRASGQVMAVGIHGQGIYIDPDAEMVIARTASFPVATNRQINPTTLPAYDALAAWLKSH